VTKAIWQDMQGFDGYLGHELIQDADAPDHLLVVSCWSSREAADAVRDQYAAHPNAQRANALVREPRRRFIGLPVGAAGLTASLSPRPSR
jgi:heme-degrading monooxygenase HmoA